MTNPLYPNEIKTDRKNYIPVLCGFCTFHFLSGKTEETAKDSLEKWFNKTWEELTVEGWKIEEYWDSEYE